jgi:MtaA/CmuA family methyltransferase
MSDEILELITEAAAKGDYKNIGKLVRKAKRQGNPRKDIIKALSAGLTDVSSKYKTKGMYLDDIIKSAGAFEVGIQSLGDFETSSEPEKRVVLGVMGGPWTIGTRIVEANLKAHGFEVFDAGSDISPEQIAKVVKEKDARIVASAIYLMQTEGEVGNLEEELWKLGLRPKVRTLLSGPAGSKNLAQKYNVDSYVKDINDLISKVKEYSEELKSEMSSYDRVMLSVKHQEPDRVPFMPFAQTFTAKVANIPFSAYVSKAEKFVEGQMMALAKFGWDAVCFSSDVGMYAEALGAKIHFPYDDVPRILEPVLSHNTLYEDFQKLKIPDPMKSGRLTESIKAIELVKKEVKDEVPIIGWTEGPFQGVTLLTGADPMQFFYILDHQDEFREILDWYADFEIEIVNSMYEAGADIIGVGETAAYFMSPTFFKDFCLEPEKRVNKTIKKLGMVPLIHCCGYVPQCIHFSKETNPGGAIQFDYQVDLAWAKELLKDQVTIMGNLNYNRLTKANPKDVFDTCSNHLRTGAPGGGFWLAFGCEIPRELPIDNMRAIMRAAKTSGKYPVH